MKHIIKNISGILLAAVLFTSCDKETGPLTDVKPPVSVTVSNAMAYRPEPTVSTTLASSDSIITITLSKHIFLCISLFFSKPIPK